MTEGLSGHPDDHPQTMYSSDPPSFLCLCMALLQPLCVEVRPQPALSGSAVLLQQLFKRVALRRRGGGWTWQLDDDLKWIFYLFYCLKSRCMLTVLIVKIVGGQTALLSWHPITNEEKKSYRVHIIQWWNTKRKKDYLCTFCHLAGL